MCLYIDRKKTKEKMKDKKKIFKFYKYFQTDYHLKELYSPYWSFVVTKPGVLKIEKEALEIYKLVSDPDNYRIEGGCFHAYIHSNAKNAMIFVVKIPIYVKKEHIIAFGERNDVCFFEYEIKEKDWNNIWK